MMERCVDGMDIGREARAPILRPVKHPGTAGA